jgi:hypothetical protein
VAALVAVCVSRLAAPAEGVSAARVTTA